MRNSYDTINAILVTSILLLLSNCFRDGFSLIKKKTNITSIALKLCGVTEDVDLIFHAMLNADTPSMVTTTHLYKICLPKMSVVASCKHLPDSRGSQITA